MKPVFRTLLAAVGLSVTALTSAAPALSQEVGDCDWQASVHNLPEPWEAHTRTFANGAIRVALLDTIEPAAMPFHLLVLSPPYDEVGGRTCKVISYEGGSGFAEIMFEALSAAYDPNRGLTLHAPVHLWISDGNIVVRGLAVTVNQATGDVTAVLLDTPPDH